MKAFRTILGIVFGLIAMIGTALTIYIGVWISPWVWFPLVVALTAYLSTVLLENESD